MPRHDYLNLNTGKIILDVFQHMSEDALTEIDGDPVRKLIATGKHAAKAPAHRAWIGQESRSVSMGLNPEQVPEFMQRCPSWEFDEKGDAIFNDDQHMKRCLKEWNKSDEVEKQQLIEEIESEGDDPKRRTDIPLPTKMSEFTRSANDG